jgi:hypothetical protein
MIAFEKSWMLMKDFYFAPEQHYGATIGYYHPDMPEDFDPENQDKSFYHDRDFLEYHKRESMDEMDEDRYDLLMPTPTEPFRRGGSMIPVSNRPGGTMGINLANLYIHQAGKGQTADNDLISQILDYLMHEDVHASTYHKIENDMEENDPHTAEAHEMAAYSLMYPGGEEADDRARDHYNQAMTKTPWNPKKNRFDPPKLPTPIPRGVIR